MRRQSTCSCGRKEVGATVSRLPLGAVRGQLRAPGDARLRYAAQVPRRRTDEYVELGQSERSRYAAHLDRGWHLYERGEFEAAASSAEHAEELTQSLPDASMLAAACATALGRPEHALISYRDAIERDPHYFPAYLAAAQLLAFDLNRPAEALELLDDAQGSSDGFAVDLVELALLEFECLWLQGRAHEARARLDTLQDAAELEPLKAAVAAIEKQRGLAQEADPEADFDRGLDESEQRAGIDAQKASRAMALIEMFGGEESFELEPGELPDEEELAELDARAATFVLRLARAHLDLGDHERALSWANALVELAHDEADAWHLLAETYFRAGDPVASVHAAVRGFRLDTREGAPAWAPGASELHDKVQKLLSTCEDDRVRALVAENPFIILIHEAPALELVLEGVDARTPALTLSSGGRNSGQAMTGIAIYRRNITRMCRGPEDFDAELRVALFGELAAALSLDDEARSALGLPPAPAGAETMN